MLVDKVLDKDGNECGRGNQIVIYLVYGFNRVIIKKGKICLYKEDQNGV